jgi:cell wall-associated NlpC family hydrolase
MKKKLRALGCMTLLLAIGIVAAFVKLPSLREWTFSKVTESQPREKTDTARQFLAMLQILPATPSPSTSPAPSTSPSPSTSPAPFASPAASIAAPPEPSPLPLATPEPEFVSASEDAIIAERKADALIIRKASGEEITRFTTHYKTDMPGGNGPAAVSGPHAWWGTKELLFHGDLVTKAVEVFLPYAGATGEITQLAADADGVSVTTSTNQTHRVLPEHVDAKSGYGGYIKARFGPETEIPAPKHASLKPLIESWLGTPYLWGGDTKAGVDCSGLTCAIYKSAGVSLPRTSKEQATEGKPVMDELRWGDLLCYDGHVAIYIGNGKVAEAQGSQTIAGSVKITTIWHRNCLGVRRLLKVAPPDNS